jgi:hypothetical protein
MPLSPVLLLKQRLTDKFPNLLFAIRLSQWIFLKIENSHFGGDVSDYERNLRAHLVGNGIYMERRKKPLRLSKRTLHSYGCSWSILEVCLLIP